MKRIVLHLYRWALRGYPPAFRQMFAGEMAEVFASAMQARGNRLAQLRFLLREAMTLPPSIFHEHRIERRKKRIRRYQGAIIMTASDPNRALRWTSTGLLLFAIGFALLVIVPFFALNLHLQPATLIRGGHFDPKGYALYSSDQIHPSPLLALTVLMMLFAPLIGGLSGTFAGVILLRGWRQLRPGLRLLGGVALYAGLALLAFPALPIGRIIMLWLMD